MHTTQMRKNRAHPYAISRFPLRKAFGGQDDEEAVDGKRIKLAEFPAENPISGRLEDALATEKESRIQRADAPKTSEYAFFRKLKGKKDHKFQSHVKNRRDWSNKFQSNHIPRESTTDDCKAHKLSSSILVVKDPSAANFVILGSPSSRALKGTAVNLKQAPTRLGNASKQKLTEEFGELPKHGGVVRATGEIFSRKREKLFKWVQNIQIYEFAEHCPKGQGVVSLLLSRLLPKSNEENNRQIHPVGRGETQNGAQLPNFSKTKFYLDGSYGKSAEDFMIVQGGQYLELPLHWPKESREREVPCYDPPAVCGSKALTWREMKGVDLEQGGLNDEVHCSFNPSFKQYESMSDYSTLDCVHFSGRPPIELELGATASGWKWDSERLVSSYDFPSACASMAIPCRETEESDLKFGSFKDTIHQTRTDTSFYSLTRYHEFISDHDMNYLDRLHFPEKGSIELQPKAPSLRWIWDYDSQTSDIDLYMNCQTKELISHSGSPISSNNDLWQSHDDPYGAAKFCPFSVLPYHVQDFYSSKSCPTSHDEHNFAPSVSISKDDVAYRSYSPLYLPSNCTDLIEGYNDRTSYALPQRLSCSTSIAPTEEIYQSDIQGCKFFSGLDANPSWKCLSILTPSIKNFVSTSTAPEFPQDGEIVASSINRDSCDRLLGDPLQREVYEHPNRGFCGGYGQSLLLYSCSPIDKEKAYLLLPDKPSWIEQKPKADDSFFNSIDAAF